MTDYSQIPAHALKQPEPFKIEISDEEIRDLKQLLKLSRLPHKTFESLQQDGKYGLSHKWLTEAKRVWEEEFDWKKCETHSNSFPNFKSQVKLNEETFEVHFIALFSKKADAIPLALYHGWPGNYLEFLPILTLMKQKYTPETLPYHLLVPSLPGYAFSSPPPLNRDFSTIDAASLMDQLMLDLGFTSYIAQGGDIGSRIATILARKSSSCKAVHVNFSPVVDPPPGFTLSTLTAREKAGYDRGQEFTNKGSAYALFHATRPSTIGLALDSSPLALLAWIGEKYLAWTDVDPSLETILESVSLYWFTESMGRGIYPYRGRFAPDVNEWPKAGYIEKPFGYSYFPQEIMPAPRAWVEKDGNLVFYREHDKGGHFAALEQPELLMNDIEEFVKQVW